MQGVLEHYHLDPGRRQLKRPEQNLKLQGAIILRNMPHQGTGISDDTTADIYPTFSLTAPSLSRAGTTLDSSAHSECTLTRNVISVANPASSSGETDMAVTV